MFPPPLLDPASTQVERVLVVAFYLWRTHLSPTLHVYYQHFSCLRLLAATVISVNPPWRTQRAHSEADNLVNNQTLQSGLTVRLRILRIPRHWGH